MSAWTTIWLAVRVSSSASAPSSTLSAASSANATCGARQAIAAVATSAPALAALAIAIVAVAYRVIPPRQPSLATIRLPAVVVGITIVALSQAFVLLAPRLVGVAALAGTLATAFIALAWLSFTFQAVLLGAAWVRVRDDDARIASGAGISPGGSRSGGRSGQWPTVTGRN